MKIKSPYLPAHRITIEPVDRVKFIKKNTLHSSIAL